MMKYLAFFGKSREYKQKTSFMITAALLFFVLAAAAPAAFCEETLGENREETGDETGPEKDPELVLAAKNSMWRLKHSIENYGFFSSRVSLNIWRQTAKEAGTFDRELYNELKKEIYEKSIQENLEGFNLFLQEKNYSDARDCLRIWKMHSKEIGVFDQKYYNVLLKRLEKSRSPKKKAP